MVLSKLNLYSITSELSVHECYEIKIAISVQTQSSVYVVCENKLSAMIGKKSSVTLLVGIAAFCYNYYARSERHCHKYNS